MDLMALAEAYPDMTVSITLSDLLKAQNALIDKVRREERRLFEDAAGEVDDLIPRNTVLQRLKVNPTTLWRWEKEGYLKAVRIGAKTFYRTSSVNTIIAGKTINEQF